ncbi:MAG: hypothetical protein ACKVX7_00630 [Planctomycetota bacterium]
MSGDPQSEYLDAYQKFDEAENALDMLMKNVTTITSKLGKKTYIRDDRPVPVDAATSKKLIGVDVTEWPDTDKLYQTFKSFHDAFYYLKQAWDKIPQQDRGGLKEPPTYY